MKGTRKYERVLWEKGAVGLISKFRGPDHLGAWNNKDGDNVGEGLVPADSFPSWLLERAISAMFITPSVTSNEQKSTASNI